MEWWSTPDQGTREDRKNRWLDELVCGGARKLNDPLLGVFVLTGIQSVKFDEASTTYCHASQPVNCMKGPSDVFTIDAMESGRSRGRSWLGIFS